MKMLLVKPPYERFFQVRVPFFHLGLGYLAACLRQQGHEVKIYDAENSPEGEFPFPRFSHMDIYRKHSLLKEAIEKDDHPVWEEARGVLSDFAPDLVGFNCTTPTCISALKMSRLAKELPRSPVVLWGGPHATMMPGEVLGYAAVDFVIRGEAEETIVELGQELARESPAFESILGLCYRQQGAVRINPPRPPASDLDSLPYPAKDVSIFPERYPTGELGAMSGGRGCPYQCTYCAGHVVGGRRVRFRSNRAVIEEMKENLRAYGADVMIKFVDDTFGLDRTRLKGLCHDILKEGLKVKWGCQTRANLIDSEMIGLMKRAGCQGMWMGLESGSDRVLKRVKKRITVDQSLRAARVLRREGMPWGETS